MRDDFDALVADRFKVLDDVPVPDTWSRVQSKVRNHVPVRLKEGVTMIDLETPSLTDDRRKWPKRALLAGILAAASVVAIALVVIRDHAAPADQPSTTVTVPPTLPPRPLFATMDEQDLGPGTYFVDEVAGGTTARIFVTLGEGWRNERGGVGIRNDDVGVMAFSRPGQVFADACHASEGLHPGPVTTLDGLVAALSEQRGWINVTTPTDITVNGYPGKTFQRTAPAEFTDCNPGDAAFRSWGPYGGGYSYYEPNETETLLVLDVNGSIILIDTRLKPDHQEASAVARPAAVLDSIRIEQT